MILSTHIIIAAAVAKPLVSFHPAFAFFVALASHYLSDAIPHWDYTLHSIENKDEPEKRQWSVNRTLLFKDFFRYATDALAGAALVALLMRPGSWREFWWFSAVAVGGVLPDFLQALRMIRFPFRQWFEPHQRFHDWIHTKIKLGPYPLIGIPLQIIIVLVSTVFLLR